MGYMIGIDVGGTFTDFSLFDTETKHLKHFKRSSTPDDPSRAIISGIGQILEEEGIQPASVVYLAHGTTVATNALIEKKGARTGIITTKGFKDLMEIGWQKRPSLYNLHKPKPESILLAGCKCEVDERIRHDGTVKRPLDEGDTRSVIQYLRQQGVQSIAICTLFSFLNPVHEKRIKELIREEFPEAYITASCELVPEFREYSRMSTTVLNAYLGPVMETYVHNFEKSIASVGIQVSPYVTQSNGSVISISETIDCPIKTAVSGPSAGVIGAAYIGAARGFDKIITFDMGGTSADISLIENGKAQLSNERLVEGYPARIPMIDIITIGAGGGSIAYVDEGGALKVGPRSAGAMPGPACYMRGGTKPTVTDANIVLGKLNEKRILGGKMEVDIALARAALQREICDKSALDVDAAAAGIISVVNSNMMRAIRVVSVERGYDVREFTLMAFGGAGPLHACEVAQEMGIRKVILPPAPGTLCSLGLLMADTRFDSIRSRVMIAKEETMDEVRNIFASLQEEGHHMLDRERISQADRSFVCSIDCRYERQNYEISIPVSPALDADGLALLKKSFHREHERAYGYSNTAMPIQMVNYRVTAVGTITKPQLVSSPVEEGAVLPAPIEIRQVLFEGQRTRLPAKVYQRTLLLPGSVVEGPAIIEQMDSTSVVPPGWRAEVDGFYNICLTFEGGEHL